MRRTAGWGMWRGGVEACVEFTRMDVGGGGNEVEGGGKIALRLMSRGEPAERGEAEIENVARWKGGDRHWEFKDGDGS